MTTVNYAKSSPYSGTPQTSNYLLWWNPPAISRSVTDSLITLNQRYKNRPDLLSYDLYGTPNLWWTFAMLNPDTISDPIWDMKEGLQIWAASNTSVQGYL